MTAPRVVVVGDALLDRDIVGSSERLCPDAPAPVLDDLVEHERPGGAALAAMLAARDGNDVLLVTALADDGPGARLRALLAAEGVEVCAAALLPTDASRTPEKVRVRAGRHVIARLDYGCAPAGRVGALPAAARLLLTNAPSVLVSDYGRGIAANVQVRGALAERSARLPFVWDPHPRGALPVVGARVVTPNRAEAGLDAGAVSSWAAVTEVAHRLRARWASVSVAITLGERGALLVEEDGAPLLVPAPAVASGDPCGAGDRFASAVAGALAQGALASEAVVAAVASASAFVGAGDPDRVLARTGVVVATGGCFDLVHAGHVRLLEAARALGDRLVVCINSDASVARLKGPGRPLQPAEDRVDVLRALGCVDEVVVFDEDTPVEVLRRLRPDVFAKGADYTIERMPEASVLAEWGGQAVLLPYLEGRSTSRLVAEARRA
jgi:rfaE bifunctional protein nucleotidyltransferase chain/domain/rfaE bifunctional protein kinase chain/domain